MSARSYRTVAALAEIIDAQTELARRLLAEGRKADARITLAGVAFASKRLDDVRGEAKREISTLIASASRREKGSRR